MFIATAGNGKGESAVVDSDPPGMGEARGNNLRATVIRAEKNVLSNEVNGETVILNVQSGEYYGLDPVGSRIWAMIQDSKTVGEVLDGLLELYAVDPAVCERDLMKFLRDLSEKKLVTLWPPSGSPQF